MILRHHDIKYMTWPSGFVKVETVDGFSIAEDKCAYACSVCGAIYQSKNIECRSIFATDDPRCRNCEHVNTLERICKCEPVIKF